MNFEQQLDVYLRARFTLIVLVTPEEERALLSIKAVCERRQRPCLTWDVADSFQLLTGEIGAVPSAKSPLAALEEIDKSLDEALFLLKDFHECWADPQTKRKLRNVAQRIKRSKKSILITCPSHKVPRSSRTRPC